MTHAFYSDAAETARIELTRDERAAVDHVRAALEADPRQGHPMPDSALQVVDLLPEETGGRGISVVYRYGDELDAALILWLVTGP
ncbi:hypothetical protein ACFP1Z_31505 [Streptomyces gamaensis]|uniref:DUF4258 domain-containing protein n=1 Tax=Streptomyces gamaensis TaxID=1763542 RepID=A0ABW0ZA01_9ACTN